MSLQQRYVSKVAWHDQFWFFVWLGVAFGLGVLVGSL